MRDYTLVARTYQGGNGFPAKYAKFSCTVYRSLGVHGWGFGADYKRASGRTWNDGLEGHAIGLRGATGEPGLDNGPKGPMGPPGFCNCCCNPP